MFSTGLPISPLLLEVPLAILLPLLLIFVSGAIVTVPNGSFAIVERRFSLRSHGSRAHDFMALGAEPGFLPEVLLGGIHFLMPFQYRIHRHRMIRVAGIGYLFARTGATLPAGQTLAAWPDGVEPGDARGFLARGGERGPQRQILRAGAYAINLALFAVLTDDGVHAIPIGETGHADALLATIRERNGFAPVVVETDRIAIVTVQDGPALDQSDIFAPSVGTDARDFATFHNSFQDIERFLAAGGRRGEQIQVLVEGTYFINRLFATIEFSDKAIVKVGTAGVVTSYTGPAGADLSGDDYTHGQLVETGHRGIWRTPLSPGKYPLNPHAYAVREVPTTNFQLRWSAGEVSTHNFDANLSEVPLITRDAFAPMLPLSIVLHISQADTPYVVQTFADVQRLVEGTLDAMVSAWFKDAAQSRTLIELIQNRTELQADALVAMRERFRRYRLEVMEVMIGTPRAQPGDKHMDLVFEQLRARQVAREQMVTFADQQATAGKRRELEEAEAIAEQQKNLTASKIAVTVAENNGEAALRKQVKEAEAMVRRAEADAQAVRLAGSALAERTEKVGLAEAAASKAQVDAFGGPEAALRKVAIQALVEAIRTSTQPLVPSVVMGEGRGSVPDLLMALAVQRGELGLRPPG